MNREDKDKAKPVPVNAEYIKQLEDKARQETFDATVQAIKEQGIEAISGISYSELKKQVLGVDK
jgi:hypothetical protein